MKGKISFDEYGNTVIKFEDGTSCCGGIADIEVLRQFGTYNVPSGTVIEIDKI